jgi:DNA-binding transcriptional LysR family regulator
MELRQLRYFVAAAVEGSISRAAKKIFLTQPALSRQIKALEEELGRCLLERRANSIQLTPAGKHLLEEARDLLDHAGQVLERVRSGGSRLVLRVGYAPSLATGILSPAIETFTQTHPGARVELLDLSSNEMLAGLQAERLDAVVSVRPADEVRGIQWTPLVEASWKLAVHRNSPLARRRAVTAAEVALEPLLIYCQRDYPEYWGILAGWLRQSGERPQIGGEYDGVDSLMAAVASGLGIALVAIRTDRLVPEGVRLKTLNHGPAPLCIAAGCQTGRTRDKPLAVFIAELRSAAKAFA